MACSLYDICWHNKFLAYVACKYTILGLMWHMSLFFTSILASGCPVYFLCIWDVPLSYYESPNIISLTIKKWEEKFEKSLREYKL